MLPAMKRFPTLRAEKCIRKPLLSTDFNLSFSIEDKSNGQYTSNWSSKGVRSIEQRQAFSVPPALYGMCPKIVHDHPATFPISENIEIDKHFAKNKKEKEICNAIFIVPSDFAEPRTLFLEILYFLVPKATWLLSSSLIINHMISSIYFKSNLSSNFCTRRIYKQIERKSLARYTKTRREERPNRVGFKSCSVSCLWLNWT